MICKLLLLILYFSASTLDPVTLVTYDLVLVVLFVCLAELTGWKCYCWKYTEPFRSVLGRPHVKQGTDVRLAGRHTYQSNLAESSHVISDHRSVTYIRDFKISSFRVLGSWSVAMALLL